MKPVDPMDLAPERHRSIKMIIEHVTKIQRKHIKQF